jgi:predicted NACHT family NTPase
MAQGRAGWAALIGWITALVAPPVIAGTVWQQFAARHLALAVTAGLLYWGAVAVGGFVTGVAGDVAGRWRKRVADQVDLTIQRRVSGFEKRYRKLVLANLRFTDLKGLATVGPFTPELDAVFVDVALVPRPPHEIAPGVISGGAPASGRRAIDEFIGRPEPAVLAVVGGPGSGKTTLLRHTARQACTRKAGRRGPGRDLPVLLYLRDHAAAIKADPEAAPLAALLRSTLGDLAAAEPPGWVEQQLRGGRCLVLLDGLDEVARQEDRAKVAAWAERQVRSFPANDFLITSRPHGYRSAPVEGAEVVQVCGFSGVQVEGFVRGWYRVAERHATRAEGAEIDMRAEEAADDLLRRLDQTPALHELAANPLLLTMIANVHRYRGALPGSRGELYSEICQVMSWRRQEAKSLASEIAGEKKETVLRALAYAMMQHRVSDLPERELLDEIRPVLRRLSSKLTPESFVADAGSNGLLVERETEQYSFAHHTFQEYLAAAHIRDKGLVHVLTDNVSDPWWRETTLLYAARADADPLVKACLDAGTVIALALAFDCAD